jgi:dihydroorotase
VVVLDPTAEWTVRPEEFYSRSRNTPFAGRRLRGRAETTIVRGQVIFARERGR